MAWTGDRSHKVFYSPLALSSMRFIGERRKQLARNTPMWWNRRRKSTSPCSPCAAPCAADTGQRGLFWDGEAGLGGTRQEMGIQTRPL